MSGISSASVAADAGPGGSTGPNAINPLAAAIDSVIAAGAAAVAASAPGAAYVWVPGSAFPTVPAGQYGSVQITGSVSGTASLPVPYNIATDDATGAVTIIANGTTPQVASVTGTDQTYLASAAAGYFVSGNFSAQGTASTGTGAGRASGNLWLTGAAGSVPSYLASDGRTDSIVATQGTNWIATGNNSAVQIWIDAGTAIIASRGSDTIAIGAADATVVGSGSALVYGGSGALNFSAIAGTDTMIGGTAAVTAGASGSASLLAYGGSAGNNAMVGDGAGATLFGGGSGDQLAGLAGANMLLAGGGSETLFGGSAAPNTVFVGGSGTDVMAAQAGGSQFISGSGTDQVLAAGDANQFDFTLGRAGGLMVVQGFNSSDVINLTGYAADAATTAFSTAQVSGGNTVLTLSDNTRIVLLGFTGLGQTNVVA